MPRDVLGGLHPNVRGAWLGDDVGVKAADGHQAAEVAALVVGLVVLVQPHLCGRPALEVARAVDGAEALTVSWNERRRRDSGYGGGKELQPSSVYSCFWPPQLKFIPLEFGCLFYG